MEKSPISWINIRGSGSKSSALLFVKKRKVMKEFCQSFVALTEEKAEREAEEEED